MTAPARFRATDIVRAIGAMEKAGKTVTAAEIKPDGSILILTDVARPANDHNPLDRLHGSQT